MKIAIAFWRKGDDRFNFMRSLFDKEAIVSISRDRFLTRKWSVQFFPIQSFLTKKAIVLIFKNIALQGIYWLFLTAVIMIVVMLRFNIQSMSYPWHKLIHVKFEKNKLNGLSSDFK